MRKPEETQEYWDNLLESLGLGVDEGLSVPRRKKQKCPKCSRLNPLRKKACLYCGQKLPVLKLKNQNIIFTDLEGASRRTKE